MTDSALSVRYRKFQYQAQSDIADHGYRTKCPPMQFISYDPACHFPPLEVITDSFFFQLPCAACRGRHHQRYIDNVIFHFFVITQGFNIMKISSLFL